MDAHKDRILVVDDVVENIQIVGEILKSRYEVKLALNGSKALEIAGSDAPPDLILLDVMMPGMDGYAVCESLKANPLTHEIPVIFLSSLHETDDKVKALALGAVDFVTKPFEPQEVLARVRAHLDLRKTRLELADRNRDLQASLTRSEELERLRDSLVHMMAHDMRTPLMALRGNLELLDMDLREGLQPEQTAMLDTAFGACTKLIEMVSAMLDVSKLESGQMTVNRQPGDIAELAGQAVRTVGGLARRCEVQIQTADPSTRANVDHDLTHRVIVNLLGNALKFTPAGGRITIGIRAEGSEIEVSVQDTGPGIPAEFHEKIFEKFGQVQGQVKQAKYSTGLGLTFCRLAVEAMGGRIGVASEPGKGSTFWFRLPRV